MKKTTRILACVWLGLALIGAVAAGAMAYTVSTAPSVGSVEAAVFGAALAIALAVFWVLPLTIAGILTLRRSIWGWRILFGHSALTSVGWLLACKPAISGAFSAVRDRLEHGPHWGGYPQDPLMALGVLAMLALSSFTVFSLLRDNPLEWAVGEADVG